MTTEEAIRKIKYGLEMETTTGVRPQLTVIRTEALKMALGALLTQQEAEKNEPLTLDELRQMDGEPAYFVSLRDGFSAWGIIHAVNMSQTWFIAVSGCERAFGDRDSYGTAWIGYRRKPKETK